jgi:hypothetical protein
MPRKVSIKSIANLNQYRKRINAEIIKKDIIGALDKEGRRLIQLAYASREFENRTKNLKDSYCYGVFVGKNMLSSGFLTSEPDATKTNRGWSGRVEAEAFLDKVGKRLKNDKISLVVGVALFYGSILEAGAPPLHRKYRVLANIEMDLRDLAQYGVGGNKYKARFAPDAEGSVAYRVDKNI